MPETPAHYFQPGNQLAKRARYVHGAIQRAVVQDDGAKLRKMVETMLDLACGGDVQAASWVRDTLDGRPAQSVEMNVSGTLMDTLATIRQIAAPGEVIDVTNQLPESAILDSSQEKPPDLT